MARLVLASVDLVEASIGLVFEAKQLVLLFVHLHRMRFNESIKITYRVEMHAHE